MDAETVCFHSLNAYHKISPQSFFGKILRRDEIRHARDSLVFRAFCKAFPLAKSEEDYLVILKIIEDDVDGACELILTGNTGDIGKRMDRIKKELSEKTTGDFKKYFNEEKSRV